MIALTRLSGTTFLLNADLVERVDCTPDTVVTLVDGRKYVVAESLGAVLDSVIDYRAAIVARASLDERGPCPEHGRHPGPARLTAVPSTTTEQPAETDAGPHPAPRLPEPNRSKQP